MPLLVKRGAHTPFGVIVLGVSKMLCRSRKEAKVTDEGILTMKQAPGFQITTVFLTLYLGPSHVTPRAAVRHLSLHRNPWRAGYNTTHWASIPGFLIQWGVYTAQECAFLTSS